MVIGCPKCKVKLKIADEKIKPEGLKIKCPKCAAVLKVKKPAQKAAAPPPPPPIKEAPAPPPPPMPPMEEAPVPPMPEDAPMPLMSEEELTMPPMQEEAPAPPMEEMPSMPPMEEAPVPPMPEEAPMPPMEEAPVPPMPEEVPTGRKVIVAHQNPQVVAEIRNVLMGAGCRVITANDGVGVMLNAVKEVPEVAVVDIALPKINGYEVSKRLKARPEVKGLKTVLVSSKTEEARARKSPDDMYGVDAYVDADELTGSLKGVIESLFEVKEEPAPEKAPEPDVPDLMPTTPSADEQEKADIERAKRLARTVFADIELYNPDKILQTIKEGTFQQVFAEDLKEGLRHYRKRVPDRIKEKGDFFKEALHDFVERKKKSL